MKKKASISSIKSRLRGHGVPVSGGDVDDLAELVFVRMLRRGVVETVVTGFRRMGPYERSTIYRALKQAEADNPNGTFRKVAG